MRKIVVLACVLSLFPNMLRAQEKSSDATESKQSDRLKALEEQVRVLAAEVEVMRRELRPVSDATAGASAGGSRLSFTAGSGSPDAAVMASASPTDLTASASPVQTAGSPPIQMEGGQAPTFGGASGNAKLLNPDISVNGDFLGAIGRNNVRRVPGLELHESEVGLQAILDPYARGDFFISFGEQGVNVEEGYITFTSLPAGLVAKVGKMRAAFGKVNTLHNHTLEWTDRPLVTENLLGGEDGIDDAGISITRILPAPKWIFLDATAQVFRGDSADVFHTNGRKDVGTVAHIRAYKDLSESSNVDLGFSYAHGHSAAEADGIPLPSDFHTNLYGIDGTFRWKPLRRAIYHSVIARTELVWSHRDQFSSLRALETQRAFGFFTSADYRLTRRWTVGGRFDRSARARQASLVDAGFSALLTYWPSEFSQIRGQYRFARYGEGSDGNELRFQVLFVLGAHGAHPF